MSARKRSGRRNARSAPLEGTPLAQMLCCGGELKSRDRLVGRWQRSVRWIVSGNVIAPDWRGVRSGCAAGLMPKRTG